MNIFTSIFTAAFYVFVPTAGGPLFGSLGGPRVENVEEVLYFVRLFSDLLGRPLAGLPRPWFLSSKKSLKNVGFIRFALSATFFMYIIQPHGLDKETSEYPRWLRLPESDAFIIVLVCVFSALSGYLSVLSYEYAASSLRTKKGQSNACTLMNTTFQVACFTAVALSVAISESGLLTAV